MIIGIFGKPGAGKTLYQTILAYTLGTYCNIPIVSNYTLNFPYEPLDIEKLLTFQYKNRLTLIDEIYMYLEARLAHSNINIALSHFVFQLRKRNMPLIFTAQLTISIDLRLRKLIDCLIIASNDGKYYKYEIITEKGTKHIKIPISKAELFYDKFNTNEIIESITQKNDNELLFELKTIDEQKEKINFLCDKIRKQYPEKEKFSKNLIECFLFENQLPKYLSSYLHVYLNN